MKYVPRTPREGINVSKEHPLVEAGTLLLALSAIFIAVTAILIFLVELVVWLVPPDAEARVLSTWTPSDLAPVAADDGRAVKTEELLARLASHWTDAPYTFRLRVSDSETPNAMAMPGGLIIVTTGLLDRVDSENELAFVLGHELGHFRNRDHIRHLGRGIAIALLFAVIGSSEGSADFGLLVTDLTFRSFSREQESDADAFGLDIVYEEYGHVNESWRFFYRLIEEEGENSDLLIYLSTHPSSSERSDELKSLARFNVYPLQGSLTELAWQ